MLLLSIAYQRPADLVDADESQFRHGGVLVPVEPPPGLSLYEAVELEITTGFAGTIRVEGQVVQLVPGAGVAVTFNAKAVQPLVEVAREAMFGAGSQPSKPVRPPQPTEPTDSTESTDSPGPAQSTQSSRRSTTAPTSDIAARIHAALHGNKDERGRIMRDVNKLLHPYVLRNTGLGLDEVLAIAKMSTVASDLLGTIAEKREWAQRPDIAIALVRNPKTPTAAAIRLLDHVTAGDLRQLAKDTHTRPAVQQAARKRVLGNS